MTANPVRPSRHRAGQPIHEGLSEPSSSDSESDRDRTTRKPKRTKAVAPAPPRPRAAGQVISRGSGKINAGAIREDAASERAALEAMAKEAGFETESEGEGKQPSISSGHTRPTKPGAESTVEEDDSSSEEEETSSEEDGSRRPMVLPRYIPKSQRQAAAVAKACYKTNNLEDDQIANKKKAIDAIVEEQIHLRNAGKNKHEDSGSDVDTEDDVDPESEYAAWKLRELQRLKRDRDQLIAREKEREEIEQRRNMTTEERQREDAERMVRQKEEKESRGKMSYMQKYYHKGAFYQDKTSTEGLLNRDIMGAKFQDEVKMDLLPQALQMRDMTKLGRQGASKYKDLKSEDTGRWGSSWDVWSARERHYEGDERFAPDTDEKGAKGANTVPLGQGRERDRGRNSDSKRERYRGDRDQYGKQYRDMHSSNRHQDGSDWNRDQYVGESCRDSNRFRDGDKNGRKREWSRNRERHGDDKRRRVGNRY